MHDHQVPHRKLQSPGSCIHALQELGKASTDLHHLKREYNELKCRQWLESASGLSTVRAALNHSPPPMTAPQQLHSSGAPPLTPTRSGPLETHASACLSSLIPGQPSAGGLAIDATPSGLLPAEEGDEYGVMPTPASPIGPGPSAGKPYISVSNAPALGTGPQGENEYLGTVEEGEEDGESGDISQGPNAPDTLPLTSAPSGTAAVAASERGGSGGGAGASGLEASSLSPSKDARGHMLSSVSATSLFPAAPSSARRSSHANLREQQQQQGSAGGARISTTSSADPPLIPLPPAALASPSKGQQPGSDGGLGMHSLAISPLHVPAAPTYVSTPVPSSFSHQGSGINASSLAAVAQQRQLLEQLADFRERVVYLQEELDTVHKRHDAALTAKLQLEERVNELTTSLASIRSTAFAGAAGASAASRAVARDSRQSSSAKGAPGKTSLGGLGAMQVSGNSALGASRSMAMSAAVSGLLLADMHWPGSPGGGGAGPWAHSAANMRGSFSKQGQQQAGIAAVHEQSVQQLQDMMGKLKEDKVGLVK